MYELVKYFEKDNISLLNPIQIVWERDSQTTTIVDKSLLDSLQQNQSPFLSKIISEENFELPVTIKTNIESISDELGFSKDIEADINKIITKLYLANPRAKLNISKSGEGEFIAYTTTSKGTYKNLVIDEDGDIEIIIVPLEKNKSHNSHFYKQDGINFSKVVSLFNGMY
jgi:hypothetical protein